MREFRVIELYCREFRRYTLGKNKRFQVFCKIFKRFLVRTGLFIAVHEIFKAYTYDC